MLGRFAFTLFLFVLCLGFAAAEEVKGKFSKIDDKGITLTPTGGTEAKTYTFAKDVKFFKNVKKAREEIKDGAKADEFKNPPKKGLYLSISTNENNEVTEVMIVNKKKAAN